MESLDYTSDLSPPGKRRKLRIEQSKPDIWNRRFKNSHRRENVEQYRAKVNDYEERGYSSDKAIHLAAYDDLPYLGKRLRQEYAQLLIDFYELQEDPVQQRILESAKVFGKQHDMNQAGSIRQVVKLRKDLCMDVWPDHNIEENEEASELRLLRRELTRWQNHERHLKRLIGTGREMIAS